MGIVKGFSDILCPPNLATNGSFLINQRGLFANSAPPYNPASVGDFFCDAWKFESGTLDTVGAYVGGTGGLYLYGHGKKGQYITIRNSDKTRLTSNYLLGISVTKPSLTAAVNVINQGNKVPIEVAVKSRYLSSDYTLHTPEYVSLKNNEQKQVSCVITTSGAFNYGGVIVIKLLADGEFACVLSNYRELAGAFINPPLIASVPYADDLLRCKRYYQSGTYISKDRWCQWTTGTADKAWWIPYFVEMAGIPTIVYDTPTLTPSNGAGGSSASIAPTISVANNYSYGFRAYVSTADVTGVPNLLDYGGTITIPWTASV